MSKDPFDLQRFVQAQTHDRALGQAVKELRAGRKQSHWMWFVFPQLRGLGRSAMAERYGIAGLEEAKAYLDHRDLGPNLMLCTRVLLDDVAPGTDAAVLMGGPTDAMKLRSSMTLFAHAFPLGTVQPSLFDDVLVRYFDGVRDPATEQLLAA